MKSYSFILGRKGYISIAPAMYRTLKPLNIPIDNQFRREADFLQHGKGIGNNANLAEEMCVGVDIVPKEAAVLFYDIKLNAAVQPYAVF